MTNGPLLTFNYLFRKAFTIFIFLELMMQFGVFGKL